MSNRMISWPINGPKWAATGSALLSLTAPCLSLLLGAGLLQGAETFVRFDLANPEVGPFPTDALTVPDSAQKTGLRVNLPKPDCQTAPSTCAEIRLINELDGFNLYPRANVRFEGKVDVTTLRLGISFVWLEDLSNEEFGLHPSGHLTPIDRVLYDPSTNTAYAKPDEVLSQHRRYALVVTSAILDAAGAPVEASAEFAACLARQDGYCGQLARVVASLGPRFAPNKIVAASVFTTLSATAWLEKARDRLALTLPGYLPASPKSVFKFSDIASITYQRHTRSTPQQFVAAGPQPSYIPLLENVGRVAFGSFRSPNFLNDNLVIPATATGADVALPAEFREVHFAVTLPNSPAPAGGYPVVIVGTGTELMDVSQVFLYGDNMAEHGLAAIAFNVVGLGGGPASYVAIRDKTGTTTAVAHPGRAVDIDGNGTYDEELACRQHYGPFPVGVRDCFRQTTIDLLQLVRMIKAGVDLDGDRMPDLDPSRVYFLGHSLAAMYGTMFTAVSPDVPAAVLVSGGGSYAEVRTWGVGNRARAIEMLGMRSPSLLNLKNDFDPDSVLRYQPVHLIAVPGALAIQEFFERIEWLSMPGDALAYASHLRASTLPGVPIKRVLFQFGKGDTRVVNPAATALVRNAYMRDATSFYRLDLACNIWPDLTREGHFLVYPILPAAYGTTNPHGQWVISSLVQEQQARFLASGGTVIPNVNLYSQQWFGKDLFETPPERLPEEMNFEPQ